MWQPHRSINGTSKDIVSAAMVLVQTLLNFLVVQLIGDALPLLSTRNIIIPPWEDPSFRFVYDASQCATSFNGLCILPYFREPLLCFTFLNTLLAWKISWTVAKFNFVLSWHTSNEMSDLDCVEIQYSLAFRSWDLSFLSWSSTWSEQSIIIYCIGILTEANYFDHSTLQCSSLSTS